jgi:hypothetical protein
METKIWHKCQFIKNQKPITDQKRTGSSYVLLDLYQMYVLQCAPNKKSHFLLQKLRFELYVGEVNLMGSVMRMGAIVRRMLGK